MTFKISKDADGVDIVEMEVEPRDGVMIQQLMNMGLKDNEIMLQMSIIHADEFGRLKKELSMQEMLGAAKVSGDMMMCLLVEVKKELRREAALN